MHAQMTEFVHSTTGKTECNATMPKRLNLFTSQKGKFEFNHTLTHTQGVVLQLDVESNKKLDGHSCVSDEASHVE